MSAAPTAGTRATNAPPVVAPRRQVCIVFENTGALLPFIDDMRKSFIHPVLSALRRAHPTVGDIQYGMVQFGGEPLYHHTNIQPFAFTADIRHLSAWFEKMDYAGGGQAQSSVGEALALALDYFEWLPSARKSILLVTATAPHNTPLYMPSSRFHTKHMADVAAEVARQDIELSVLCTRELTELRELFISTRLAREVPERAFTGQQFAYMMVLLRGLDLDASGSTRASTGATAADSFVWEGAVLARMDEIERVCHVRIGAARRGDEPLLRGAEWGSALDCTLVSMPPTDYFNDAVPLNLQCHEYRSDPATRMLKPVRVDRFHDAQSKVFRDFVMRLSKHNCVACARPNTEQTVYIVAVQSAGSGMKLVGVLKNRRK